MFKDLSEGVADWQSLYRLCISFINPRPIALVSTVDASGRQNLAPFSFYNMVCANPPIVMISTGYRRDGVGKDTLANIRATGEFAVATVVADICAPMVRCAADLPPGESEFAFSGLTPTAARLIRPALVAESPVNIECRVREILPLHEGPGGATLIFGTIIAIHVKDDVLTPDGVCDPHRLSTVGRLGGKWYADVMAPYERDIPLVERRDLTQAKSAGE